MLRFLFVICLVFLAGVVYGLFQITHEVEGLKKDLVVLNREIASDREMVHVLKAEWAYLSKPSRIKDLADRYLDLKIIDVANLRSEDNFYDMYIAQNRAPANKVSVTPTLRPILSSMRGIR